MELSILGGISKIFINDLPENVAEALEDVELLIVTTPLMGTTFLKKEIGFEEELELDCKGAFIGSPAEISSDTESEGEEIFDYPEGFIIICASNITNEKEAALVLTHEVAHALGWDEEEVKQFGLGVDVEAPKPEEGSNVSENSSQ